MEINYLPWQKKYNLNKEYSPLFINILKRESRQSLTFCRYDKHELICKQNDNKETGMIILNKIKKFKAYCGLGFLYQFT